jgi:hypothetical protein
MQGSLLLHLQAASFATESSIVLDPELFKKGLFEFALAAAAAAAAGVAKTCVPTSGHGELCPCGCSCSADRLGGHGSRGQAISQPWHLRPAPRCRTFEWHAVLYMAEDSISDEVIHNSIPHCLRSRSSRPLQLLCSSPSSSKPSCKYSTCRMLTLVHMHILRIAVST